MALRNDTYFFGMADAKIFPITEDSASTYSVDTGIDVPGIKNFSLTPELTEVELTGDEVVLATHTKVKKASFSFECAKLDFQMLQKIMGGRYNAAGTTPNQSNTYSFQKGDLPGFFQLGLLPAGFDTGLGSVRLYLMKCKISAVPIEGGEDAFNTLKVSGSCLYTDKEFTRASTVGNNVKGLMFDIIMNETATALTAITS